MPAFFFSSWLFQFYSIIEKLSIFADRLEGGNRGENALRDLFLWIFAIETRIRLCLKDFSVTPVNVRLWVIVKLIVLSWMKDIVKSPKNVRFTKILQNNV